VERVCLYVGEDPQAMSQLSSMASPLELPFEHCVRARDLYLLPQSSPPGVIVTESKLRDGDWRDVLTAAAERLPRAQVLVISHRPSAHFWADVLDAGAYDIITQPFRTAEVQRLLLSAWLRHDQQERKPLHGSRPLALRAAV
jgi:DNA-binding NtrC family response regulator